VHIRCPDAEKKAILKSRIKDLGIDEDIIAFQLYEKSAAAMTDQSAAAFSTFIPCRFIPSAGDFFCCGKRTEGSAELAFSFRRKH
jgi:hypothetical protein